MKHLNNLVMAGVFALGLVGAAQTRAMAADPAPMGGKMSMSDQKMLPGMMKGMSMADKPMMMKMCRLMMPAMSATDKKTMMGMSVAEKQMCMNMCKTMMPEPKPMAKKPMVKKPMPATGMGKM